MLCLFIPDLFKIILKSEYRIKLNLDRKIFPKPVHHAKFKKEAGFSPAFQLNLNR